MDMKVYTNGWEGVDTHKISQLLQDAFNKNLSADFFSTLNPKYVVVMYERDKYIAAAIVEKIPLNGNYSGIDYVNKLAVSKEQQGKGIGHILLNVVDERSPKFILRASPDNHDAHLFYKKRGNGKGGKPLHLTEGKRWDVYYTDMAPEEFKFARTYAVSKPETLIPLLNKEIIVNVSRKKSLSNRI